LTDAFLQLINLRCTRADRVLVDRLNLLVKPGDIVHIQGANGSGKTTLLRTLCGLLAPDRGAVHWRKQAVSDKRSPLLYIGHQPGIKVALTPRENLQWLAALSRGGNVTDINSALATVGLQQVADTPCHLLSAGQRQRVALARLFVERAAVWLLDEPFAAVDKDGTAKLEQWIEQHAEQGGAVLLTTHHKLLLARPVITVAV
jgi:heme exporter protein A